jgi:hypothetical protein
MFRAQTSYFKRMLNYLCYHSIDIPNSIHLVICDSDIFLWHYKQTSFIKFINVLPTKKKLMNVTRRMIDHQGAPWLHLNH